MSRLRDMMADGGGNDTRLSNIVRLIANTMVADVCSLYLRAQDGSFELMATQGLDPRAVGRTRLQPSEGLVGQVAKTARALSVQDAPLQPNFAYRPETGEDPYRAFLGVPLLKSGRVIGVLVVQNETDRVYDEEEIETLQTIAMVLTEMVATGTGEDTGGPGGLRLRQSGPLELRGRVLSGGIAMGPAVLHDPVVPATKFFAPDVDRELERLERGLAALHASIDDLMARDGAPLWGETRDVLETFRLMAQDPSWTNRLADAVGSGLSAEAAVDRVRQEHRVRLGNARDAYLRDRLHDLEDLDNRLLRILTQLDGGSVDGPGGANLAGAILFARRLGPAELLEYQDAGLKGIVLEEGGAGSHAMIVARALDLPAVGDLTMPFSSVDNGDLVILDGETGQVHVRPDAALPQLYDERIAIRMARRAEYARFRDEPAQTLDGIRVDLMINGGLSLDINNVSEAGADGIGLFRTEFQFLVSETLPQLSDQVALYKRVLDAAGGKPVLFRTLDLGGDKVIPTMSTEREENPALGFRSIRLALERKGLFRRQLRALIRAANGRPLSIMFPLVASAEEFHDAKALVKAEMDWSRGRGQVLPETLSVGAMIEAPSIVYDLPRLTDADFLSVGTNDLFQFFFAADRENPKVADRYDSLSHAALSFLADIRQRTWDAGIPVSICGETAGRTLEALALVCLGYRRLSMSAGEIGPVKAMIRSVNLANILPQFRNILASRDVNIRKELLTVCEDHRVVL